MKRESLHTIAEKWQSYFLKQRDFIPPPPPRPNPNDPANLLKEWDYFNRQKKDFERQKLKSEYLLQRKTDAEKNLSKENIYLRHKLDLLESQVSGIQRDLKRKYTQVEGAEAINRALQKEIRNYKKALKVALESGAENASLGEQVALRKQLANSEHKNQILREELNRSKRELEELLWARQSEEEAVLQKMLDEQKVYENKINKEHEVQEELNHKIHELIRKLEFIEADNQALQDEQKKHETQKEELETALWAEHDAYTKLFEDTQKNTERHERELGQAKSEARKWRREAESLLKQKQEQFKNSEILQERLQGLQSELDELKKDYAEIVYKARESEKFREQAAEIPRWRRVCEGLERKMNAKSVQLNEAIQKHSRELHFWKKRARELEQKIKPETTAASPENSYCEAPAEAKKSPNFDPIEDFREIQARKEAERIIREDS